MGKKEKTVKKEGDFSTYSQADLRLECKARGLQVRGSKRELLERVCGKNKLATPIRKTRVSKPSNESEADTKEATGLTALSQADMRKLLKEHSLQVRGTKAELLKRLKDANITV